MSSCRLQAQVDVPPETLWELVGNVERHPQWWPRVVGVQCDGLEEGCSYRQVFQSPIGVVETDVSVERLEGCHELTLRCLDTGTYAQRLLTEAQGARSWTWNSGSTRKRRARASSTWSPGGVISAAGSSNRSMRSESPPTKGSPHD